MFKPPPRVPFIFSHAIRDIFLRLPGHEAEHHAPPCCACCLAWKDVCTISGRKKWLGGFKASVSPIVVVVLLLLLLFFFFFFFFSSLNKCWTFWIWEIHMLNLIEQNGTNLHIVQHFPSFHRVLGSHTSQVQNAKFLPPIYCTVKWDIYNCTTGGWALSSHTWVYNNYECSLMGKWDYNPYDWEGPTLKNLPFASFHQGFSCTMAMDCRQNCWPSGVTNAQPSKLDSGFRDFVWQPNQYQYCWWKKSCTSQYPEVTQKISLFMSFIHPKW